MTARKKDNRNNERDNNMSRKDENSDELTVNLDDGLGGLLPDNWGRVALEREKRFLNETIQRKRGRGWVVDGCVGCPGLRALSKGNTLYTWCVFSRCIKRYPSNGDYGRFR